MPWDSLILEQLPHVLAATNFSFLGQKYEGKVRDNYTKNGRRFLIATDRLSCFDVVVTTIPFKGQVLTQLAAYWFDETRHIVKNHMLDVPDPNVMVVVNCEVLPVEVVVRDYLTGSAWRDYEAGRPVSGIRLPEGLQPSEKLPHRIITPSSKAKKGEHDKPISEEEILQSGCVSKRLWEEIKEKALALFEHGSKSAALRGLILVDTKYEFGLLKGELILVDEIHTLDSSRYWLSETYARKFHAGEPPEMLDKEPVRQWLLAQGYKGDGPVPHFSNEHRVQIAKHYISSYERICGREFKPVLGDVAARIAGVLAG